MDVQLKATKIYNNHGFSPVVNLLLVMEGKEVPSFATIDLERLQDALAFCPDNQNLKQIVHVIDELLKQ